MTEFVRQLKSSLANWRVWLASGISVLLTIVGKLIEDRFYSSINGWLDARKEKVMELTKPVLLWIIDHPAVWPLIVLIGILLHSYWRSLQKQELSPVPSHAAPMVAPVLVSVGWKKPYHNVQYAGFKVFQDAPLTVPALWFRNVPIAGKLLGKFELPRVRVIYYNHSTGEEIADMCPVPWWDEKDGSTEISADGRYASIASCFEGKWSVCEENQPVEEFDSWHKLNTVEVPAGDFRIIATLSSFYANFRIQPITGVLTLREDGTASFVRQKMP